MRRRIAACLGSVLVLASGAAAADAETLITAQEASLPASHDVALATRGVTRGPKVEVASPAVQGAVKSPLDLKLKFQSFGGATVDPDSVKVTYLKEPQVDLTPRLKKYIKPTGIEMPSAELPPGQHELRVSIKDSDGRSSSTTFKLTVGP
jgi:hypothetical protein